VPSFENRRTVADDITDTVYQVTVTEPGQYWYRIRGYNSTWGWGDFGPLEDIMVTATGIASAPAGNPKTSLTVIGPNPTGDNVSIRYGVGSAGSVDLTVFDATGRAVRRLVSGSVPAGVWTVRWNKTDQSGEKLPAGVYFCRLNADRQLTARLVISR
jgi:hypothetical protein